jgi:hypothetical protein
MPAKAHIEDARQGRIKLRLKEKAFKRVMTRPYRQVQIFGLPNDKQLP